MKARLALAAALVLGAACADDQKKEVVPTAPPPSKSVTAAAAPVSGSTVCLRYARDAALAHGALKDNPTSARLQVKAKSMDDLIKNACQ
jgi:uncharacterized lipoprotein YajG